MDPNTINPLTRVWAITDGTGTGCKTTTFATGSSYVCDQCQESTYMLPTGLGCLPCLKVGCKGCASDGTGCIGGCSLGLFNNAITDTCDFCYIGCLKCTSGTFDQCTACKDGFYWQRNKYNLYGTCIPCHGNCKTCFGGDSNQCGTLNKGFFFVDLELRTTAACDANCRECKGSPTQCTRCYQVADDNSLGILNQVTGTCTLTTTVHPSTPLELRTCKDAVLRADMSYECIQCAPSHRKEAWGPEKGKCLPMVPSRCELFSVDPIDERAPACDTCLPSKGFVDPDTKLCESSNPSFCSKDGIWSYGKKDYCTRCDDPVLLMLDVLTGICGFDCDNLIPGIVRKALSFNQGTICTVLPQGCLDGFYEASGTFFCTQCDTGNNWMKVLPTDPMCIDQDCSALNDKRSVNKQCTDTSHPFGACHSQLCFITSGIMGGQYPIYQLLFREDYLVLSVNPMYSFHLTIDVRPYVRYTIPTDPLTQETKIHCDLVTEEIMDGLSICTYFNGEIRLYLISSTYRDTLARGHITFKKDAFKISRNMIQTPGGGDDIIANWGFDFVPLVPLDLSSKKKSNWAVVSQAVMGYAEGIKASLSPRSPKLDFQSYRWEAFEITPSSDTLFAELAIKMLNFTNLPLNVQLNNTGFIGKTIKAKCVVVDQVGQEHWHFFSFEVHGSVQFAFHNPLDRVYPISSDNRIKISLLRLQSGIIANNVIVQHQGLCPKFNNVQDCSGITFEYNIDLLKRALVLSLKVIGGKSDFTVTVGHGGAEPTRLFITRWQSNYPATAIHEATMDNIQPFQVQFFSRSPTFSVFCVDEVNKSLCSDINNPGNYNTADGVVLNQIFSFPTEAPKKLYFRGEYQGAETMTRSFVVGKVTVQPVSKNLLSRELISMPEHPVYTNESGFYLDAKLEKVTSVSPGSLSYLTRALVPGSQPSVSFTIDASKRQVNQGSTPNSFLAFTTVNLSIEGVAHSVSLSRQVGIDSSLVSRLVPGQADGLVTLSLSWEAQLSGVCNDSPHQFYTATVLDDKYYLFDAACHRVYELLPGVFKNKDLKITQRIYSYCGPLQSSQPILFRDTSSLVLPGNLQIALQLFMGPYTELEEVNSLVLRFVSLNQMLEECEEKADVNCVGGSKAAVIDAINKQFESIAYSSADREKFFYAAKLSLLTAVLKHGKHLKDANLEKIFSYSESIALPISAEMTRHILISDRFERPLQKLISDSNVVLADTLDYGILMGGDYLYSVIFGFQNNEQRNNVIKVAIAQIVNFVQIKLTRISSLDRKEETENDFIQVLGQSINSPPDSEYTIEINNETAFVIKNLQFAETRSYFEIIVLYWKDRLLTEMRAEYEEAKNDMARQRFYIEFSSIFKRVTLLRGQIEVHQTSCLLPPLNNCPEPPSVVVDKELCFCLVAQDVNGKSPTLPPRKSLLQKTNVRSLNLAKVSHFKFWQVSTPILLIIYLLLMSISFTILKKAEAHSQQFSGLVGTAFHFDHIYREHLKKLRDESTKQKEDETNLQNEVLSRQSESIEKTALASALREYSKHCEKLKLSNDQKDSLKPLTKTQLFLLFMKLKHSIYSFFVLHSQKFGKKTMIFIFFVSRVIHLGISMIFFFPNVEPGEIGSAYDYSESESWLIRISLAPIPCLVVGFILKKCVEVKPIVKGRA